MEERNREFDVIFAFAFGSPENLFSNHLLAERAVGARKRDYLGIIPIVTQMDIARAKPLIGEKGVFVVDDKERYGEFGYPSTLKLVKRFYNFNKNENRNWEKVLVVATPMHATRCVMDLRKMGFDAYEDEYLREHYNLSSVWWYDRSSDQWWTRSSLFWWSREIPLRILSKLSWTRGHNQIHCFV